MIKRYLLCFLGLLMLAGTYTVYAAEGPDGQQLYAQSACLMDGSTGRVLYGKEEQVKRPNASTTKIMTCILALELGEMQAEVVVSERAARQPRVRLGARPGEEFFLEDLLYSLMLESHNDTAVMLAEHVAGSVEAFALLMNEKAKEIGCTDTYFITPNGLDDKDSRGIHSTTAADLARIMRYCIRESPKHKDFLKITGTSAYTFWNREETVIYNCHNHNAFLAMMKGAISGKTGFTADAGYCYVGALERDGKLLIVALLACGWPNHKDYKWADTKKLMSYGLERYQLWEVPVAHPPKRELVVLHGQHRGSLSKVATVPLTYAAKQQTLTVLMRNQEKVSVVTELPDAVFAPIKKGSALGRVSYRIGDTTLANFVVYAGEDVKKIDFIWCFDIIKQIYLMKYSNYSKG